MQHHPPNIDEQPSPLAILTVLVVPLPGVGPADCELPTSSAHLMISKTPLLPWGDVEGAAPLGQTEPAA
jgi:hypothetical protein